MHITLKALAFFYNNLVVIQLTLESVYMKMLFVLLVYTLYSVCSMLFAHNVNMSLSQHDLNTSTIIRQSLLHKLDNDTELFDECDYLDLTNSQTLDIKDCDLNLLHLNV